MSHRHARWSALSIAAAIAAALAATPIALFAQAPAADVVGRVTDAAGRALAAAVVTVEGTSVSASTDDDGRFRLARVPGGAQRVTVRSIGYAPQTVPVTVAAGAVANVALRPAAQTLGSVRIEGQRDAQARALNRQRTADVVSNVVSSDVIGRTPDNTAAEALQRLPGVSIQRDQGEGRFVQIRGTPPEYTNVSVNGERLPSPDRSTRAIALDAIMPDALARIEVSKTLTPDLDGDAIGGRVNLVTKTAEEGRTSRNLTLGRGYNQLNRGAIQNYAGTFGKRFTDGEKVGLLLGGSYQTTDRASNDLEMDWNPVKVGAQTVTLATDYQPRDYRLTRTRQSYVGTFDVRPTAATLLVLRANVDHFEDSELRLRTRFRPGTYQVGDSATASRVERTLRDRTLYDRLQSYVLHGEHSAARYTVDGDASWSQARETNPHRTEVTLRQSNATLRYDLADPYDPRLALTKGAIDQGSLYSFNALTENFRDATDRDLAGRLNVTVPLRGDGWSAALKLGGAFRGKVKDSQESDVTTTKFPVPVTLDSLAGAYTNADYRFSPAYFSAGNIDASRLKAFIDRYAATRTVDTASAHLTRDPNVFRAEENVSAGYAMMTVDVGKLRLIPGARVERTSLTADGLVVSTTNGVWTGSTPSTTRTNYTNVLPSLNARFQLDPQTNLRAAVTRSLARPIYDAIRSYAQPDVQSQTVALGNPSLHAALSTNVDAMAERFFAGIGVVSAGYFEKHIADFIAPVQFTEASGPWAGYIATQPQQGGDATIRGVELNWQQQFTALPGLLGGLGLNANYTYTRTRADVPNQNRTASFPGQVPHTGNVAVFFERGPLQTRLALNFKDSFLDTYGTDASTDLFTKRASQLDFAGNVLLGRGVRLFLEAINLTNQPLVRYKGVASRPIQQEYYEPWYTAGIRWVP